MNFKLKTTLVLSIIILIASIVRFWHLDKAPLGLYVDDAVQGYNAYSLLKTGKDEYGQPLPVFLRSYGAFTPALALYFLVLPIKIFGLSIFSLRFSLSLIGVLFCVVFAILCGYLYPGKKILAMLVGGLIVAILPAHILFSRAFFESPLSLFLFLVGLVCFFRRWPIRSGLFLSFSTYAYHTQRVNIYLFLIGAVILFAKEFGRRKILVLSLVFIITQIPNIYFSTFPGPSTRFFNLTWIPQIATNADSPLQFVYLSSREYFSQYLAYYNPYYLFWLPDPDTQRSLPELSVFYPWQIVVYLVGLGILIRKSKHRKLYWLILAVSPAAAALTKDPFSVLRASLILIPTSLIVVSGTLTLLSKITQKKLILVLVLIALLSFGQLYRSLFILLPNERYSDWLYGYNELFSFLIKSGLPAIVDADKPVYILYLYYQKIDPLYVQSLSKISPSNYYSQTEWADYYHDNNITFKRLDWKTDIYKRQLIAGNSLLVSTAQAKEHFLKPAFIARLLSGEPLLFAYQTDPVSKCASQIVKSEACLLK